jgi:hypothetical protein
LVDKLTDEIRRLSEDAAGVARLDARRRGQRGR